MIKYELHTQEIIKNIISPDKNKLDYNDSKQKQQIHFYINSSKMHSFSKQNYILKEKWLDAKRTKNHPKICQKAHSFCNLDYEWADEKQSAKVPGSLINPSIPNITLPKNRERTVTVNYEAITEQDLDDWVAQSINRNISSILNPQKKFFVPPDFQNDLNHRYRNKTSSLKGDQDIYFNNDSNGIRKKLAPNKRGKFQVSDLLFDYKRLETKHVPGTPIRIRQNKNRRQTPKRRNAVFLSQDVHYGRLIKEMSKSKETKVNKQSSMFLTESENMFYSYNLQSMLRKSSYQHTPSSITEQEYNRLKEPPKDVLSKKREQVMKHQGAHQKFRQMVMDHAKNVEKKFTQSANSFSKVSTKYTSMPSTKPVQQSEKPTTKHRTSIRKNSNLTNGVDTKSIGKDKTLEKKVLNLLNDMHIVSEPIDVQMSEINIHLSPINLKTLDSRPQTKWVLKAEEKLQQQKPQLSIDCYKQALIIQPQFFVPIFNIALLLQREKQYYQSIRWFEICKEFQIDEENVMFGMVVVLLKQMKLQECYELVEQLIKRFDTSHDKSKDGKLVYYYIRALCCKKLSKFQQAKTDYNIIMKNCKSSNLNYISNFIFSIMFSKSRRLATKFDCLSYVNVRQTTQLIFFTPQKRLRLSQSENLVSLAPKLISSQFFKRFSISLVQKLLSQSTYEFIKQDQLIFINENQTAIILNGVVVVRNHLKQFNRPQNVAVLPLGGIIGAGQIDGFVMEKANNWFIATSDVELIKIQKKAFFEFWKGQVTFQVDFKYNFLKNVGLFKNLPESTLFSICQKIEKVEYSYGTILFNDCSYRNEVISKRGLGFGLGKKTTATDPRFVGIKKIQGEQRKKGRCRIVELLKKHFLAFDDMKFCKLKYPGLFILIKGKIQVQDDRGFRCSDIISQRQYFGQNLFIESDGFHNYGRMVVSSQTAQLYHLPIDKLIWTFTSQDKRIMSENTKNRQSLDTVSFLRSRFLQCQSTRMNYKQLLDKY